MAGFRDNKKTQRAGLSSDAVFRSDSVRLHKRNGAVCVVDSPFCTIADATGFTHRDLCLQIIVSFVEHYDLHLELGDHYRGDIEAFCSNAFCHSIIQSMPDGEGVIAVSMMVEWMQYCVAQLDAQCVVLSGEVDTDPHTTFIDGFLRNPDFGSRGFLAARQDDDVVCNIQRVLQPYKECSTMNWFSGELEALTLAANILYEFQRRQGVPPRNPVPNAQMTERFCDVFLNNRDAQTLAVSHEAYNGFS